MVSSARATSDPKAKEAQAKDRGAPRPKAAGGNALQLDLLLAEKKVKQLELEAARCAEVEAENHRLARRLQMARQSREQRESTLREQITQRREVLAKLQEESTILALEEASSDQMISGVAAQPLGKVLAQELRNSHRTVTRAAAGRAGVSRKSHPEKHDGRTYAALEKDGHLLWTAVELEAIDVCYNIGTPEVGRLCAAALHPVPVARELEDMSHHFVNMWEDMSQKTIHTEAFHAERASRLEREVSRVREQTGSLSTALEHALMDLAIEEFVKAELMERNLELATVIRDISGIPQEPTSAEPNTSSGLKARVGAGRRSVVEEVQRGLERATECLQQVDDLGARVAAQAPDVWPALFRQLTSELRALRAEGGRLRTKLAAAQLTAQRETAAGPGPRLLKLERHLESELFSARGKVAQLLTTVEPLAEWTAAIEAMLGDSQPGQCEPMEVPCMPEMQHILSQIRAQLEGLVVEDTLTGEERSHHTSSHHTTDQQSLFTTPAVNDTVEQISMTSAQHSSITSAGHEISWAGLYQAESEAGAAPCEVGAALSEVGATLSEMAPALSSAGSSDRSRMEMREQEIRIREQVQGVVEDAMSRAKLQASEYRVNMQVRAVMEDAMSRMSAPAGSPLHTCGCQFESGSGSSLSEARRGEMFEMSNFDEISTTNIQCLHPTRHDQSDAGSHFPDSDRQGSTMTRVWSDGFAQSSEQSAAQNVHKSDHRRFPEAFVDDFVEEFTADAVATWEADGADSRLQHTLGASSAADATNALTYEDMLRVEEGTDQSLRGGASHSDLPLAAEMDQHSTSMNNPSLNASDAEAGLDIREVSDEVQRSLMKEDLRNLAEDIRHCSLDPAQELTDAPAPLGAAASTVQAHTLQSQQGTTTCRAVARQLSRDIYKSISCDLGMEQNPSKIHMYIPAASAAASSTEAQARQSQQGTSTNICRDVARQLRCNMYKNISCDLEMEQNPSKMDMHVPAASAAASSTEAHAIRSFPQTPLSICRDVARQASRDIYTSVSQKELRRAVRRDIALDMANRIVKQAMFRETSESINGHAGMTAEPAWFNKLAWKYKRDSDSSSNAS